MHRKQPAITPSLPVGTMLLCAVLACAGCASAPPDGAAQASAAPVPNPRCHILTHAAHTIRSGDNVPVTMEVQNTGRGCRGRFGWSSQTVGGSTIVNQPSHGTLQLVLSGSTLTYTYRPAPGYLGSDDFLISVPSGFGQFVNLAVAVSVHP